MPFLTYLPEHMGSIKLAPSGPFIAGSYCSVEYIDPPLVARAGLQPF
jgi:hypothetical protein